MAVLLVILRLTLQPGYVWDFALTPIPARPYTERMSEKNGAWIRTVPICEADDKLVAALEGQGQLYPKEYRDRIPSLQAADEKSGGGIVMSHSPIPGALYHPFSTFRSFMAAGLP